jgi:DNA-binding NarL/FixJ family response regulator
MEKPADRTGRPSVVLADDNAGMRAKVIALLNGEFDILKDVADGAELIQAVGSIKPDVAIVDITMPRIRGIEAVRQLMDSGSKVRVVFLTVHEDPDFARAAADSGAYAFVVKSRMAADLIPAVRSAIAGEWFSSLEVSAVESKARFG